MNIQGKFRNKSSFFQFIILFLLILLGVSLTIIVQFLLGGANFNVSTSSSPASIRWMQLFSSVCLFFLPALGAAFLFSNQLKKYLHLQEKATLKEWGIILGCMLLLNPLISFTSWINQQLVLPESLSAIEQWMQTQEIRAKELTDLLLSENSFSAILSNLFVLALCAGLIEEFLFRGVIQRIIEKSKISHHWVIWITAILFSALHMQFYGFIPRMLLGAFFGYIVYRTGNLWLAIWGHFLNNGISVLAMSSIKFKDSSIISNDYTINEIIPLGIVALICSVLFYFLFKKIHPRPYQRIT